MIEAIITGAVRVLEFIFLAGILGSAVVVALVTIEDMFDALKSEPPESAGQEPS